jgi:hypothetical protein
MKRLGKSALLFIAIGLAIYAGVYYAAERLMLHTGRSNPFFKIATAQDSTVDWVILGASHAMPLDFADFNAQMERETRLRILNLAAPGTGPLYNRFVLEHFLRAHRTRNVLYVVDSFAFYSRTWNEERFADAKLLRRTPFELAVAARLWDYARHEGVDPRAVLDYVTGFSKINNRERFERDIWEGEKQFDRVYRTSASAVKKRIDYLYPEKTPPAALARYLGEFSSLIELARREGVSMVVIKLPAPPQYRSRLPDEAAFDDAISRLLAAREVPFHDFSPTMGEPSFYFDTDHLNRAGLTEFFAQYLKTILVPAHGG